MTDAPPAQLRAGGLTTIRYQLPATAAACDLPSELVGCLDPDRGELLVHSAKVTAVLDALVGWAHRHEMDLAGLGVGPPSLEDAYLALTTGSQAADGHAAAGPSRSGQTEEAVSHG